MQNLPRLTPSQLARLSNIMDNAGQVILATMVFNPLLKAGLDRKDIIVVISGLAMILFLWSISLSLAKEKRGKK